MIKFVKKTLSIVLALITVFSMTLVIGEVGALKADAANWNGTNYGGGKLYGYRTFLEAFGIDYDTYMKWMDDHDANSPNPNYYLGTPYVGYDHRNPRGDCWGAYGAYDTPGVPAMNCTGFVWHMLYKAAVHSGASYSQISRLQVMGGVPVSWANLGVYRIYFNSLEEAYASGVMEKGDVMWIYGSSDSHNAIFYGDSPRDWIYWDSAGERNRYCEIHSIGTCLGLWVAKVTQPNDIELQIDTKSSGQGTKFGAKYCIFDSKSKAQAALNNPDNADVWDKRKGTIVLDKSGHGVFRTKSAPSNSELWTGNTPNTNLSYFKSSAKRVSAASTYYAVQWSDSPGIYKDKTIRVFRDSGKRTSTGYRIYSFNAPIKVATPKFTKAKSIYCGVKLAWEACKGTYKYRIYYKNKNNQWTRMAETTSTSYVDKKVKNGNTFTYTIRCVDKEGNFISDFNSTGWKVTYTKAATPIITSLTSTPEGVQLKWNPSDNVAGYRVYYKNAKGKWIRMGQTAQTTYIDYAITPKTAYTYTVRCVDKDGDFISDYNDKGWKHTYAGLSTPKMTSVTEEAEGIRLKWDPVEGTVKYRLYRKKANGDWAKFAETNQTEFFDDGITSGKSYTYTIRCINSKGYATSDFNKTGWTAPFKGVDTPQIDNIAAENTGIRMSWQPVEGARYYRVYYQKDDGSWQNFATTTNTEYFDETVEQGKTYTYTVRCVNATGHFISDYDKTGKSAVFKGVDTPKFDSVESEPEGIRLKWSAPGEGDLIYCIYYKNSNGGWTRMAETRELEYFDKKVEVGKSYTYTIRCINRKGTFVSGYDSKGVKCTYDGVDTPQITSLESTEDGVMITWTPVEGAVKYRVFYKNSSSNWERLTLTANTTFLDTNVSEGKEYTYTVRCVGSDDRYISLYNKSGSKIV